MVDLLNVQYARTGESTTSNDMGMREMQSRAYAKRQSQYLLIKAPPASGKSRAMMFLGLHKLHEQGLCKVVVAVPESSIGASFKPTDLTSHGFFADWKPDVNLCYVDEASKTVAFRRFMADPDTRILICTHSTLRNGFKSLSENPFDGFRSGAGAFDETLVAIDEFHHVSAEEGNRLGEVIDDLMRSSTAHLVAMTGSYFRGDTNPILLPQDEARFDQVTYTYYEQLNGYKHLRSLGIGYHFYQGRYIDAVKEVLDLDKKTIIHIPHVASRESTGDKYREVDELLGIMWGTFETQPSGIIHVTRPDGRVIKVADLVTDTGERANVQAYLRTISDPEDLDIIIALGMAKEGFDWPFCEHVLTIGYRSSMTEIVQIIGRATRDSEGKTHAQFTNLIAQPDAKEEDVRTSVNNMLKAITVSLLMEQVLAPNVSFKPRSTISNDERVEPGTVVIEDKVAPVSEKVLKILNGSGREDILATLLQKPQVAAAAAADTSPTEVITQMELPRVIERMYPDLKESERDMVCEGVLTSMVVKSSGGLVDEADLPDDAEIYTPPGDEALSDATESSDEDDVGKSSAGGSNQFVKMGNSFVNIEHLNIDLIEQINPFQGAYEILSRSLTSSVLRTIQDNVASTRSDMSVEEAVILWPRIQAFSQTHGRPPSLTSDNPMEKRYAEALAFLRKKKAEKERGVA